MVETPEKQNRTMTPAQFAEIKGELAEIKANQMKPEFQKELLETLKMVADVMERHCEVLEILKRDPEDEPEIMLS